jgi:phage/plasmid-like protein (TIGR03299 family)
MADNINRNILTGQDAFYGVKKPAWHLKGFISDRYETSGQVLVKSGLNFEVAMHHNLQVFPSGKQQNATNSYYTFRTDTEQTLGEHVSKDYTIVQNTEAFSFLDSLAGPNNIYYETAGALGNGEIIFITAKLPSHIKVLNHDVVDKYIFLTTRHDGKGSIIGALTPIRIVCNNTLNMALKNCETLIRIRHTEKAHDKLKEAERLLKMVDVASPVIEEAFNHVAKVRITDPQLKKLIQTAIAPNKDVLDFIRKNGRAQTNRFNNLVDQIFSYAKNSPTQQLESTKGTLFGAYNAMTGYFQNRQEFKNDDVKVKSILLGGNAQRVTQKTFDLCLNFAQNGECVLLN